MLWKGTVVSTGTMHRPPVCEEAPFAPGRGWRTWSANNRCRSKTSTIVSTVHTTLTRLVTKIDTVIIAVISTSFVDTVVTLTESKPGATYTDITYVTTTVLAKRSEPSSLSNHLQDAAQQNDAGDSDGLRPNSGSLALPADQQVGNSRLKAQPLIAPAVARRQESSRPPATSVLFSTVTSTSVITELEEVISTISSTTTISSISVVVAEVHRTRTQSVSSACANDPMTT